MAWEVLSQSDMTESACSFVPPFCPRTSCRFHHSNLGWRWLSHGHYSRHCAPQRIRRFRCVHCGVTFSTQTFSTTYYLKRPELLTACFHRLLACSGYRQIAREARCAHTTVMGQAARLGRHALLYLTEHRPRGRVHEPLVIDGFESFAHSQFQPLHLNTVVGAESHYVYGFTQVTLRRKGRMTEKQRQLRKELEERGGKPDPKGIEREMAVALKIAAPEPQALVIRSDEHPAYPRALRHLGGYTVEHQQTPSVQSRTPQNPMFPVNLLDLLLRHNGAHHKRETIAFAKRHQAVLERDALLILWRNFTKRFSENRDGGTPAMRLGLRESPLSPEALVKERLFPTRVALPRRWQEYYGREIETADLKNPRRHALKRAI